MRVRPVASGPRSTSSPISGPTVWRSSGSTCCSTGCSRGAPTRTRRTRSRLRLSQRDRGHTGVQPALLLVPTGPASGSGVLTRGDPACAWGAADRGIAVVTERVDQQVVLVDVALDVLVGPGDDRIDLHPASVGVPFHGAGGGPLGSLGPAQTRGPCGVGLQGVAERLDLAHRTTQVGV